MGGPLVHVDARPGFLTFRSPEKKAETLLPPHDLPRGGAVARRSRLGTVTMLQGGTIQTAKAGDGYTANDARVCGNIQTRNATVYLIDAVPMPKN